jgi:hypothetical protein
MRPSIIEERLEMHNRPIPLLSLVSFTSIGIACITLAFGNSTARAQAIQPAPKTIALVASIGDRFSFVRLKQTVGSNMLDPYTRTTLKVRDQALNHAVLRGLDRAMGVEYPESERIFLSIAHDPAADSMSPHDRETHAFKHVLKTLEPLKERQAWDQIVVVTPKWLFSERSGMAGKLVGIGLYVQPLEGAQILDGNFPSDFGLREEIETPDREKGRSKTYVAPFFYANVTTLDAKTLNLIKTEAWHDFRKLFDPKSTALDVMNSIPPEHLAGMIDSFIETAALRSMTSKPASVFIGPLKSTPSSTTESTEKK